MRNRQTKYWYVAVGYGWYIVRSNSKTEVRKEAKTDGIVHSIREATTNEIEYFKNVMGETAISEL